MTTLSELSGPALSAHVAEVRGLRGLPLLGRAEVAADYRPDRNIRQAMELLEDGTVHWSSASLLESSRGKYGASFSMILNGGAIYSATAWSKSVCAEALARAICEAWCEATKNENARENER